MTTRVLKAQVLVSAAYFICFSNLFALVFFGKNGSTQIQRDLNTPPARVNGGLLPAIVVREQEKMKPMATETISKASGWDEKKHLRVADTVPETAKSMFTVRERYISKSPAIIEEENDSKIVFENDVDGARRNEENNSTFFGFNPQNSPPWVMFYNVFVPSSNLTENELNSEGKGTTSQEHAISIIQEHMKQILSSFAATGTKEPLTIFFNSLGDSHLAASTVMKECEESNNENYVRCTHMEHFDRAFEDVTLNRLHEFCSRYKTESFRVIYAHNKGSFNPGSTDQLSQDMWRRHATMAATNELCLRPPNEECNLCGLHIAPFPLIHQPGNFFVADCGYVRKLLPPTVFATRNKKLVEGAELAKAEREMRLDFRLQRKLPQCLGINRFSNEMWVGSHPSVQACDLSTTSDFDHWRPGLTSLLSIESKIRRSYTEIERLKKTNSTTKIEEEKRKIEKIANRPYSFLFDFDDNTNTTHSDARLPLAPCVGDHLSDLWKSAASEFVFAKAPRHSVYGPCYHWSERNRNTLDMYRSDLRDYSLLPGLLFRSINLYNETPPSSSWVYDWYPSGAIWKKTVEERGNDALSLLLSPPADLDIRSLRKQIARAPVKRPKRRKKIRTLQQRTQKLN